MNPLATEISRLVDNTKDVSFRIGKAINTTTVEIHGGTQIKISNWVGYPGDGNDVLVLLFEGTVIGLGLANFLLGSGSSGDYLPLVGGTLSGPLTAPDIYLNDAAGNYRGLGIRTNGVSRWELRGNDTAETGADTGTNFELSARHDNGSHNVMALNINRATGLVQLIGDPTAALHAATKGYVDTGLAGKASQTYVDTGLAGKVSDTGDAMSGGLGFGSAVAASPTDVTRHLALYGTSYGLNVTSSTLNIVPSPPSAVCRIVTNPTGPEGITIRNNAGGPGPEVVWIGGGYSKGIRLSAARLEFMSSAGVRLYSFEDSGIAVFDADRFKVLEHYNVTTTTAVNVNVTSNGYFARFTSSYRYKENISPLVKGTPIPEVPIDRKKKPGKARHDTSPLPDPKAILKIVPVHYVPSNPSDGDYKVNKIGVIAEQVGTHCPWALVRPDKDSVDWNQITASLLHVVQEQQKRIESLENRVAQLESPEVSSAA